MSVRRWIDRWEAYWFPPSTMLPLSLARIIAVAAQLFWFAHTLSYHLMLLERNHGFVNPQLLVRLITAVVPRDAFFTPSGLGVLFWVTRAAGVLALVGLFTRVSVFVFALGTWIFIAHAYSYGDVHHTEAVFVMFLMCLAFSPSGASLSLDAVFRRRARAGVAGAPEPVETAMWPLKFVHVMLSLTYFSTGIAKLIRGGFQWMNGYTLQGYTFADALHRDLPLGIWLGQQHTAAVVLSVGTMLFEVFYFVSLVLPWTAPFWFFGAILFHLGLYFTAGHPFFQHIVLNFMLLLFIAPPWWRARLDQYLGGSIPRWLRSEGEQQAA